MKKTKVSLRNIFGSEMAQNDPNFPSYSLDRGEIMDDLLHKDNNLLIINAARGSGKSGLLIQFESKLKKASVGNIVITKYFSDMVFPSGPVTVSDCINYWKNTLLGYVVSDIGLSNGAKLSDDSMTAHELSEYSGQRTIGVINSILKRVKFFSSVIEKCEFDPNINIEQLSRIVSESTNTYWILLDEMDDIYDNGVEINLLIGLLLAASFLSSKFSNVKIRLSIRPHIMTFLRTTNGAIQKLSESEMSISWNKEQLRTILAKRLDFYEKKTSYSEQKDLALGDQAAVNTTIQQEIRLIKEYFDDFDMSFRKDSSSSYRAFGTLCFYRPRWMIEFCKEVYSIVPKGQSANYTHYRKAFVPFGNRRIQFVAGEFNQIYPFIQEVMSAMVGARQSGFGKTKKLRSAIINRIIKTGIVSTEENMYFQKALEIARALYNVEFLRGKERISGGGNYHRFHYYTARPDLLTSWNHEPQIVWEIHPTFQRAFNIEDSGAYVISDEVKLVGKKNQN